MSDGSIYHQGSRDLQDRFDTRRLADRLEERLVHPTFTDADRAFIARSAMFFLATADAGGRPDCSYKGGLPGFVQVLGDDVLAFPDYDGNGMFRSLGNIQVNPHVGMLFIDFEHPDRMRVSGEATIREDDSLLGMWPGAHLVVRVRATAIFPNCPRYIHRMALDEPSIYVPRSDHEPPDPEWKARADFCDVLPRERPDCRR